MRADVRACVCAYVRAFACVHACVRACVWIFLAVEFCCARRQFARGRSDAAAVRPLVTEPAAFIGGSTVRATGRSRRITTNQEPR